MRASAGTYLFERQVTCGVVLATSGIRPRVVFSCNNCLSARVSVIFSEAPQCPGLRGHRGSLKRPKGGRLHRSTPEHTGAPLTAALAIGKAQGGDCTLQWPSQSESAVRWRQPQHTHRHPRLPRGRLRLRSPAPASCSSAPAGRGRAAAREGRERGSRRVERRGHVREELLGLREIGGDRRHI